MDSFKFEEFPSETDVACLLLTIEYDYTMEIRQDLQSEDTIFVVDKDCVHLNIGWDSMTPMEKMRALDEIIKSLELLGYSRRE